MSIGWFARTGGLVCTAVLVAGCAGTHLYSETRDKQGQDAKAAWQQVDLGKVIEQDRQNLGNVLQAQLDTQDKVAQAISHLKLRSMLEQPTVRKGIVANIDAALRTLSGTSDPAQFQKSRSAYTAQAQARRLRELQESVFRREGLGVPSCDSVRNPDEAPDDVARFINDPRTDERHRASVMGAVEELHKACQGVGMQAVYEPIAGGVLGAALKQAAQDQAAVQAAKDEGDRLAAAYRAAAPKEEPQAGSTAAAAGTAAGHLGDAVAALEKSGNAYAARFISKEKLAAIDKFVADVSQGEADGALPADASPAAKAYVLLPKLFDDARASLAEAKKPLLAPFVMARRIEQLKLDAANKEIALLETRARLSQQIVGVVYEEIVQLWNASTAMRSDRVKAVLDASVADAFASGTGPQKEQLYYATALYLDAMKRLDARWRKLEYQRIATYHEVALAYAEASMNEWAALIGTSVDQVSASAASGLKPERINGLINSLGILWIGNGVNK